MQINSKSYINSKEALEYKQEEIWPNSNLLINTRQNFNNYIKRMDILLLMIVLTKKSKN